MRNPHNPIFFSDILIFLCIKFAILAPVCLVVWLLVMPAYAWVLAHVTGAFLRGERMVPVPAERREGNGKALVVKGARELNLKDLDVRFPLGTFTLDEKSNLVVSNTGTDGYAVADAVQLVPAEE